MEDHVFWRAGAVAWALLCGSASPAVEKPERLNVLFIAVDDLRPTLGCFGAPVVRSPNIDRLAEAGVVFRRAYCQQAVCAPSRASLLSGLRPDSTGIFDLEHPLRKTLPDVRTLPQHFREAGYETVSLGKIYHHANDDNGKGWSLPAWHPEGPWKGRGYLASEVRDNGAKGKGLGPAFECADVADEEYPDGRTAVKAQEEMRRLAGGGKPFFLAVGFIKPHLPFNAPKRYWDLYKETDFAVPAQREWPEGMPPIAGSGWGEMRQYTGIPAKGAVDDKWALRLIHGYHACVSYTDALVGRLLDAIQRLALSDRTVVVLWGDHGWKLGEYGAWCKHTNLELDTHAPLIVSVPGQAGNGKSSEALVEFVDLYPTLTEVCGLGVPAHCEGTSLAPLLADPARPWKEASFSQYPRGALMGYTLRSGRWRYTEWIVRKTGAMQARELYDHERGPLAARNLVEDAAHKAEVDRLAALLNHGRGWRDARGKLARGSAAGSR